MAHWLFKSEPSIFPWSQLVAEGQAGWDGVRNWQAANNMKAMRAGETGFFYHSNDERAIVGKVEVVGEYRPDPTDSSGRFGLVDVRPLEAALRPVTLKDIKAHPALAHLPLVRQSRLSVSAIDDAAWDILCRMAEMEP